MLNQHKTIRDNIQKFNVPNLPLVDQLVSFIRDKKKVRIADIGSGPFCTIGRNIHGIHIEMVCSDNQDFTNFYHKYNVTPLYPIEYQNMEKLTYEDESFDIVHCANALDHTKDALQAVKEMIRVCKKGGVVYINCHLDQMNTGHKHFWNAKEDGTFESKSGTFELKSLGFSINHLDTGIERRYQEIIAVLFKE